MFLFQDAHLHLQDADIEGGALQMIGEAKNGGVGRLFINGTSPKDWTTVQEMADGYPDCVVPFYGAHPWRLNLLKSDLLEFLEDRLKTQTLSGLGEIGLDRGKNEIHYDLQKEIFSKEILLASQLNRPASIHCIDAWEDLLQILKNIPKESRPRFMIHSYRGSKETLQRIILLGGYISFSIKLLMDPTEKTLANLEATPIERLFLETDYPYLPDETKGRQDLENYMTCLQRLYAEAARLKRIDSELLKKMVWDNGTVFLYGTSSR